MTRIPPPLSPLFQSSSPTSFSIFPQLTPPPSPPSLSLPPPSPPSLSLPPPSVRPALSSSCSIPIICCAAITKIPLRSISPAIPLSKQRRRQNAHRAVGCPCIQQASDDLASILIGSLRDGGREGAHGGEGGRPSISPLFILEGDQIGGGNQTEGGLGCIRRWPSIL